MPPLDADAIARAAGLVGAADGLVFAAGAGMGVDSGLPDFRGNQGFWSAYPALGRAGLDFMDVASPATFERDPALAWGFYGHRLALYRRTVPHAGFAILCRWGERARLGAQVFTSNVDGQFQKAGFAPDQMLECHGSIHHLQCLAPCRAAVWRADAFAPDVDADVCRLRNAPPRCPHCGGLARPNILMFGDGDWLDGRCALQRDIMARWLDQLAAKKGRLVVVELGAGTAIPSVRNFGQRLSQRLGARLLRINPRESGVTNPSDVGIASGSLAALQAIDAALAGQGGGAPQ